jgi:hypothetical protein
MWIITEKRDSVAYFRPKLGLYQKYVRVWVKCSCGRTERWVMLQDLRSGHSTQCRRCKADKIPRSPDGKKWLKKESC